MLYSSGLIASVTMCARTQPDEVGPGQKTPAITNILVRFIDILRYDNTMTNLTPAWLPLITQPLQQAGRFHFGSTLVRPRL